MGENLQGPWCSCVVVRGAGDHCSSGGLDVERGSSGEVLVCSWQKWTCESDGMPIWASWAIYLHGLLSRVALLLCFTVRAKDDVCWLVLWMTILEQSTKALHLKKAPCLLPSPRPLLLP